MIYIEKAYKIVRDNFWLWLLPLAIVMLGFFWSLSMALWPLVKPGFHLKFVVPVGLPSMAQILQQQEVPLIGGSGLVLLGGLAGIISLGVSAFVSGGWLHSAFRLLNGEQVLQEEFLAASAKFLLRLVGLRLLNILLVTVVVLPLGMIFPPFALFAILFAMALTFFWEIAIVKEDLGVIGGLQRGWEVFKANVSEVLSLALLTGFATAVLSIIINGLAQSMAGYPLAAVSWIFISSVFSVAVCDF